MKSIFTIASSFLLITTLFGQADTISGNFVHNDSVRSYLLYVPASYDGSNEWPLVINYHGFNNSAADQMFISRMNSVADTANFLIVYPQGLIVDNPFLRLSKPGWNIDGTLSDNDDVDFTNELIDQVGSSYAVDPARVYATGWSMGGSIAFQLSCTLSDRFAAVASVANQMTDHQIQTCNPGRPYSALLIHGTDDPIVPFDGDTVLFSPAYSTPSFWAGQNSCSMDSLVTDFDDVVTSDSSSVTMIQFQDCDAQTEVLFYRINGGGHSWPGGGDLPAWLGNVNRDINASSEIWNFFNRNPHPDPAVSKIIEKSFIHEDSLRSYLLYVPAAYDGLQDWPLVLNLHGYALDAQFQMNFSNMNAVADTAHFLVAYPQGSQFFSSVAGIPPHGPGWNISAPDDTVFISASDVNDVDFLGKVIDHIGNEYRVAPDRVYSTGHSNGAMMSYILACELSDRIAAIAPVGGTIPESRLCSAEGVAPTPVLHIHGTADSVVPYDDGDPFLHSVDEILLFWTSQNGCDEQPDIIEVLPDLVTSDNSTVERYQWQNCNAEILHYRINDGGHQWPGGNNLLPFLGNFNLDINASSEIWNFFNRNPHPNPRVSHLLEESFVHNDSMRSYLLYVPATYDGSADWPLIINYHGFTNSASDQMSLSQMNSVADTAGFLIAYPQGLLVNNPFLGFSAPGWNIDGTLSDNDDVDFTSELIDQIGASYAVDPGRVYATGWSMGGSISFQVSCTLSDRIAAVASVANQMTDSQIGSCNPGRPYAALLMHGTNDPIVPFDGDTVLFSPAYSTPSFWVGENNCSLDSLVTNFEDVVTTDSSSVTMLQYLDCDEQTEVLFYRINGGGHSWPGGGDLPTFLGNVNRDIDASSEIWNFFNRNPHPNVSTSRKDVLGTNEESVKLYPNPFHGELTIECHLSKRQTAYLTLFNSLGQPVTETVKYNLSSGLNRFRLNMDNAAINSGVYYLSVVSGERRIIRPVLYNQE